MICDLKVSQYNLGKKLSTLMQSKILDFSNVYNGWVFLEYKYKEYFRQAFKKRFINMPGVNYNKT